jgi:cysteine desulfurase / selenocysteine lyase
VSAVLGDRSLFPDLDVPIYADHAAVGPAPAITLAAGQAALESFSRLGTGAFPEIMPASERARAALATLIGGQAADVALLGNTSQGVAAVAFGIPWTAGDRVLVFDGEFPANITPWQRAATRFDLELVWGRCADFALDPAVGLAQVEAELKRGLRLVAVSAVQFQTGLRMPLEALGALCGEHGAKLFVDGIQALGSTPLDVDGMGIDYLAAGGHKWLMATLGTGMLWARDWSTLTPPASSWLSHTDGLRFLSEGAGLLRYDRPMIQGPALVEGGGWNAAGHAMLATSAELLVELGVDRIHAHVQRWIDALEEGLCARGFRSLRATFSAGRSCLLCVEPPVDALAFAEELRARGVALSTPDGWIRFAPHWPNSLDEVPRILDAVDEALSRLS